MSHQVTKGVMNKVMLRLDGMLTNVIGLQDTTLAWRHVSAYTYPFASVSLHIHLPLCFGKTITLYSEYNTHPDSHPNPNPTL